MKHPPVSLPRPCVIALQVAVGLAIAAATPRSFGQVTVEEVWSQTYNSGGGIMDRAVGVGVDHLGDVIVTGQLQAVDQPDGFWSDFYTVKYSGRDGTLRWEKYFSGLGNWRQIQVPRQSLALGPNGVVAVSGSTSFQYNLDLDFATVLYRRESPSKTNPEGANR